jgi:hypothetical protein
MPRSPRFPIYIPSKGRADIAKTMPVLDKMGVPYRVVVEEAEHDSYAARFGEDRIIILDPAYQADYDSCDEYGLEFSKGSGPARNFIWDHAQAEGHPFHWIMDDNIVLFERYHQNQRIPVADGTVLYAMEDFVSRYRNIAMAGPEYHMFTPSRNRFPPYRIGTRIYSCILIRTDVPFRWRGRYNEDTILSLDVLKAGWQTVLFVAFLQWKVPTQSLPGGNTDAFYAAKGTLPKSEMLARLHPDVAKVVWRYNRWHHEVNYGRFRRRPLILRDGVELPAENPYRLKKVARVGARPSKAGTNTGGDFYRRRREAQAAAQQGLTRG